MFLWRNKKNVGDFGCKKHLMAYVAMGICSRRTKNCRPECKLFPFREDSFLETPFKIGDKKLVFPECVATPFKKSEK